MPLNKRSKLSLKVRKHKSEMIESDPITEKLTIVDMPDNGCVADSLVPQECPSVTGFPPVVKPSQLRSTTLIQQQTLQVNSSYVN